MLEVKVWKELSRVLKKLNLVTISVTLVTFVTQLKNE